MVEGHIEGREHSGLRLGLRHEVILGIIELEEYDLVDVRCVCVSQIVEYIKALRIVLQFCIFGLRWDEMDVILAFILGTV